MVRKAEILVMRPVTGGGLLVGLQWPRDFGLENEQLLPGEFF